MTRVRVTTYALLRQPMVAFYEFRWRCAATLFARLMELANVNPEVRVDARVL